MKEFFLNRPLTELEIRLRDQKRCIACGTKVSGRGFECKECYKTRLNMPIMSYTGEKRLRNIEEI